MGKFNVGDRVVFKTWEEMKAEFGLNIYGAIECENRFTSDMERSIDKDAIYTVVNPRRNAIELNPPIRSWLISEDMLKLASTRAEEELFIWEKEPPLNLMDKLYHVVHNRLPFVDVAKTLDRLFICLMLKEERRLLLTGRESDTARIDYLPVFFSQNTMVCPDNVKEEKVDSCTVYGAESFVAIAYNKKTDLLAPDVLKVLIRTVRDTFKIDVDADIYEALINLDQDALTSFLNFKIEEKLTEEKTLEIYKGKSNIESYSRMTGENHLKEVIKRKKDFYEDLLRRLATVSSELRDAKKELAYFLWKNKESRGNMGQIVKDTLMADIKNITAISCCGESIQVQIVQPLMFFEEDEWEVVRGGFLEEDEKLESFAPLMDAIFARKAELKFEQGFVISFQTQNVERMEIADRRYGIPNPHIQGYDCWGDNYPKIIQYLRNGDIDLAYAQAKSAIAGINVTDSPVLEKFGYYLTSGEYRDIPCITDMETGKVMTIPQAIEYYRSKEETKE